MAESNEYVEKLKKFADSVGGTFQYQNQATSTMKRVGWSRVDIKIPQPEKPIYYTAFSGTHSAEIYSGFFAGIKLPSGLKCRISRKDPLDKLFTIFGKKYVKTNQPGFDRMFTVKTNNSAIVRQLTGKKSIRKFFELNLVPPLQFEIIDNEKGFIKDINEKTNLIALKSNEWMVDQNQLNTLLDGFKLIMDELN
jgi:hypothetical protein